MNLIQKYDIQGPRYTSYPPVPFWKDMPSPEVWTTQLSSYSQLDLYLHIPFCKDICHYCGCNRKKLECTSEIKTYLDALIAESKLYSARLGQLPIQHVHLGGGTPTILDAKDLDYLLGNLINSDITGSIEAAPLSTTEEKLKVLYSYGFRKISFGVQDLDEGVQKQIGRIQPYEKVAGVVELARKVGFQAINFDLIFGLPGQTPRTIEETFQKVELLKPDTIAFYSFAYVPKFASNQLNIDQDQILTGSAKRELYEIGRELLANAGYLEIGMDHFALSDSALYQSFSQKEITRSFMGYTVKGSPALLSLGASSISSTSQSYIQNDKDISKYCEKVMAGSFPFLKGHQLTPEEMTISKWIQDVMCINEVELTDIERYNFKDFIEDGLVSVDGQKLKVHEQGRAFLRNICMRFDPIVINNVETDTKFSRTI